MRIAPEDWREIRFTLVEFPDGEQPGSLMEGRTGSVYSEHDGWIDPSGSLIVHVCRAKKKGRHDGWHLTHAATMGRLSVFWLASSAFECAEAIAPLCDWGDWTSILPEREHIQGIISQWTVMDEEGFFKRSGLARDRPRPRAPMGRDAGAEGEQR